MSNPVVRTLTVLAGLLVISAAIALLIAELLLTRSSAAPIVFVNELRPYIMFGPPANYTWKSDRPSPSSRSGEHAVSYTNADGLRIESPSYRLAKSKPEGQFRIAMLGGSTVHIGTRFESTLPAALRRELRSRFKGRDIEVINGGIISAISRQELIFLLTTILDYEPDMVVTYDGINDSGQMLYFEGRVDFPYFYGALEHSWSQLTAERRDPIWRLLAGRSAVVQALWPRHFPAPQTINPIPAEELISSEVLRLRYAKAHQENWRRISRVCSSYGIEPVFVLQPTSAMSQKLLNR